MIRRVLTMIAVTAATAAVAACGTVTHATPPPAGTEPPGCPATSIDPPSPTGDDELPEGAYAVRLCPGPGTGMAATRDALVENVDKVVDAVNSLDPAATNAVCTSEIGPGYALVFGYYENGRVTTRTITGELYSCGTVRVGTGTFHDPDKPLDAYVRLLTAQRQQRTPPAEVTAGWTPCGPGHRLAPGSVLGRPADAVRVAVCVPGPRPHPAELSKADLSTLLADLRQAHFERYSGKRVRALPRAVSLRCSPMWDVLGVTAWGDPVRLPVRCDGRDGPLSWERDGDHIMLAPMSPEAQRIVLRYVAAAD